MKFAIVFALMLSSGLVWSAESSRASLSGYKGFVFGMTEQQARAVMPLGPLTPDGDRMRMKARDPAKVDGVEYGLSVILVNGALTMLSLQSMTQGTELQCQAKFDRVVSLIQSRYGAPDRSPKLDIIGRLARSNEAVFTFRDSNSIVAYALYAEKCTLLVAYKAGKGGSF
jgi:hypothetical protein